MSDEHTHPRIIALRSACTALSAAVDEYQRIYVEVRNVRPETGSEARLELNERLTRCMLDMIGQGHIIMCGLLHNLIACHGPGETGVMFQEAVKRAHEGSVNDEVDTILKKGGYHPWKM